MFDITDALILSYVLIGGFFAALPAIFIKLSKTIIKYNNEVLSDMIEDEQEYKKDIGEKEYYSDIKELKAEINEASNSINDIYALVDNPLQYFLFALVMWPLFIMRLIK